MKTRHTLPAPAAPAAVGTVSALLALLAHGWRCLLAPRGRPVPAGAESQDQRIRQRLLDTLAHHPSWNADASNVHVHDGVVFYQGLIRSLSERRIARVAAQAVPGVREVRDSRVLPRDW